MRSRLEALKAALTEIDTYGVLGAESVDEAQVTRLPGWVLFYANCLTLDARESWSVAPCRCGNTSESGSSVTIRCTTQLQMLTNKRRQKQLKRRISSVQTRCCVMHVVHMSKVSSLLVLDTIKICTS